MSNPLLKKAGQKISLTKEEMKEYLRCADDPTYFIERYVKIITIDEGLVNIKLWKFQKEIVKTCHKENRVVLLASRQIGKTTTVAVGFLMWYAIFNSDKIIAILAQKEKTAKEILARIKIAYSNLPKWIQQGIVEWNKESIELENNSKILSESTSSGAIRGYSISLLYLDEFAYVPNNIADDFLTSVYPTISSGKTSKIIISSTPNGMNSFYKICADARLKRNEFKILEYDWKSVPTRDQKWADQQLSVLGDAKFQQEHSIEFLGSAGTLISSTALKQFVFLDALEELLDHKLKVYEKPIKDHQYVLTADSSHGKELDYSAFCIFDITQTPYRIVAKYIDNNISAQEYPNVIATLAKHYNRAYVLGENNDIGSQVLQILTSDLEYDNCLYTEVVQGKITTLTLLANKTPGIRTTSSVKRQGCNALKTLVESGQLTTCDFDLISEFSTFVIKKNKTYAADEGCHDDLVMCCILFAWLSCQPVFKDLTDLDMRKKLFDDHLKQMEEQIPPQPVQVLAVNQTEYVKGDGILWQVVPDEIEDPNEKWSGYPTKEGFLW